MLILQTPRAGVLMMNKIALINLFIPQSFLVNVITKYFTLTFPHNARSKAVVARMKFGF
jgi:hypothetical protein